MQTAHRQRQCWHCLDLSPIGRKVYFISLQNRQANIALTGSVYPAQWECLFHVEPRLAAQPSMSLAADKPAESYPQTNRQQLFDHPPYADNQTYPSSLLPQLLYHLQPSREPHSSNHLSSQGQYNHERIVQTILSVHEQNQIVNSQKCGVSTNVDYGEFIKLITRSKSGGLCCVKKSCLTGDRWWRIRQY